MNQQFIKCRETQLGAVLVRVFTSAVFASVVFAKASMAFAAQEVSQTPASQTQEPSQPPAPASASAPSPASASAPSPASASATETKPNRTVSITRVVGEAGTWFVTTREVKISNAVDVALSASIAEAKHASTGAENAGILSGQEKTFAGEVSRVLDCWVVYLEAKSLLSQTPMKAEVNRIVKLVLDRWSERSDWNALEVSNDELRGVIERKIMARDFERLKSDPQLAPVSDEDAQAYFRKNRLRFGSLPFETFKDNIKTYLVKTQTEKRLAEWHEVLRRKYKVRNFIAG